MLFLPNVDNAFSDNYFDLLPNEKKIIEVKTKNLKSDLKRIEIKTLIDAY
ncbi:glycoside hydrolase family 2 protein [Flavobacterium circumlabens]